MSDDDLTVTSAPEEPVAISYEERLAEWERSRSRGLRRLVLRVRRDPSRFLLPVVYVGVALAVLSAAGFAMYLHLRAPLVVELTRCALGNDGGVQARVQIHNRSDNPERTAVGVSFSVDGRLFDISSVDVFTRPHEVAGGVAHSEVPRRTGELTCTVWSTEGTSGRD